MKYTKTPAQAKGERERAASQETTTKASRFGKMTLEQQILTANRNDMWQVKIAENTTRNMCTIDMNVAMFWNLV